MVNIIDGLQSMKSIVKAFTNPNIVEEARKDVLHNEFNDVIVDTCIGFDTNIWETGVQINGREWIITQQYPSREKAVIGHQKYVDVLKKDKNAKLPDLNKENSFAWG